MKRVLIRTYSSSTFRQYFLSNNRWMMMLQGTQGLTDGMIAPACVPLTPVGFTPALYESELPSCGCASTGGPVAFARQPRLLRPAGPAFGATRVRVCARGVDYLLVFLKEQNKGAYHTTLRKTLRIQSNQESQVKYPKHLLLHHPALTAVTRFACGLGSQTALAANVRSASDGPRASTSPTLT